MTNEKNTGLSGAVTLLTAFIAVVLIVFSMLALSQAQADARRANIAAKSSANWYSADYKAQTTLAALRRGEIVPDTDKIGPNDYSWKTQMDQRKHIEARVRIQDDGSYEIFLWQLKQNAEWVPEHSPFDDVAKP